MTLNKKQKKQLDVARKKQQALIRLLADARKQTDDPQEIVRLEKEVAEVEAEIEKLKAS